MSSDQWHGAQEAIDKQIAAHEIVIRELRTCRNGCAPISKLPAELLGEIFILAKLARLYPDSYIRNLRKDDPGWLNVAHVCRIWRYIALSRPRMWNTLNSSGIRHLEWAVASLERSRNAPLHVKCTDSLGESSILSIILVHMDRIGHLEIHSDGARNPNGLSKIMEMIGTHNAPSLLQSLHLYNYNPLYNREGIHPIFSAVQLPCLHTLNVKYFALPPAIPVLPQLRHFSYTPSPGNARLRIDAMLSLLRSMPALERLELGSHTLETSDEVIKESTSVELSELSFISCTMVKFVGASLFRFIRYPHSTRVRFFLEDAPVPAHAAECLDDLTAITLNMGSGDDAANIDTVTLEALNDQSFSMTSRLHDEYVLEIRMASVTQDLLPLFRLSTLLRLPLSGVHNLEILGFASVKEEDWANLFTRQTQAQMLVADQVNLTFIHALTKPLEAGHLPFPKLKILALRSCDFGLTAAAVKQFLEGRSDLGLPIDVLRIHLCRITKDIVRQMEAFVKVEWDGDEQLLYELSVTRL